MFNLSGKPGRQDHCQAHLLFDEARLPIQIVIGQFYGLIGHTPHPHRILFERSIRSRQISSIYWADPVAVAWGGPRQYSSLPKALVALCVGPQADQRKTTRGHPPLGQHDSDSARMIA